LQHPATHSGTYPRWAEERKRPIRKTDCSEHQAGSCSADVPAFHSEFCQAERIAQLCTVCHTIKAAGNFVARFLIKRFNKSKEYLPARRPGPAEQQKQTSGATVAPAAGRRMHTAEFERRSRIFLKKIRREEQETRNEELHVLWIAHTTETLMHLVSICILCSVHAWPACVRAKLPWQPA